MVFGEETRLGEKEMFGEKKKNVGREKKCLEKKCWEKKCWEKKCWEKKCWEKKCWEKKKIVEKLKLYPHRKNWA